MADDYGTDVQALDDLPDPEVLVSGDVNVGYALGRRLLTPPGAMDEIGEEEYDSIDLRGNLGARMSTQDVADLRSDASRALSADERVDDVSVDIDHVTGGLELAVTATGDAGPFRLVVSVDGVSATLLRDR